MAQPGGLVEYNSCIQTQAASGTAERANRAMSSRRSRADDAACTHRQTDTHTRLYDVPHQLTAIDMPQLLH